MAPKVLVLGDALLDVHVTPAEPMRPGADVPAAIRLEPGGQGANLAVRLARRGVGVTLRCALGADTAGDMLRTALARDGVVIDAGLAPATGSVVVLVDADGRRTMLSQRVPVLGSQIPAGEAAWLVVSGYVLLESAALVIHALPQQRAVVGCALDDAQVEPWLGALQALAPSLVVLNFDEATLISGGSREPAAALAAELKAVVVVTSPSGATAAFAGETVTVARDPVPAIDTTGAGDALAAALIAQLIDGTWPPSGDELERALMEATALAAAVTRATGAQARVAGER